MIFSLSHAYEEWILGNSRAVLVVLFALLAFFAYHAKDFQLDASADSLLLEDDEDLRIFRDVSGRYPSKDLLVVTFTPEADLFSDSALDQLQRLRGELRQIPSVDSIISLLDVPLLKHKDMTLVEAVRNIRTLDEPTVDRARAKQEILESPIFKDLILSSDGRTTALLISLQGNEEYAALLKRRTELREKRRTGALNSAEEADLEQVSAAYDQAQAALSEDRHQVVEQIRAVMSPHQRTAVLYLGGVPMITDDMVTFVRNDLVVFGSGVLLFLIIVLSLIFGEIRWVALPLLSCFYAGLLMIGVLGLVGWKVTVISSNFLALMLIITMSMNIHLIVRYKQLCRDFPSQSQLDLVSTTVKKMVRPCLYTALTTIIGFSSLAVSDIKPVIDFGWMMSAGLSVTFLTSFLLFPSILVLLSKSSGESLKGREFRLPGHLATLTATHGGKVLALSIVLAVGSAVGIAKLKVENSFINYFSESTEIFKGLKLIDQKLGGTTPLQIVINLKEDEEEFEEDEEFPDEEEDEDLLAFEKLYIEELENSPEYWFTPYKIDRIKEVHDYFDALPEVGKVLSVASIIRVGEDLNKGQEFDSFQLSLLYKRASDELKATVMDPYVSVPDDEARIFLRILDSREDLRRKEFLIKVKRDLKDELGFEDEDVIVTGLLVLYNNMLQSLFKSQISTLGVVMVGIGVMFLILFRSIVLTVIGIVPNLLGALVVLGMMGWLDIPLDMMTITIAAITIGIAVDNGIHYIYRFREEFAKNGDYVKTLHLCHSNIGKAVLYTTTTVIFGFSILVLSNFIPTIYFGLLTALAMLIALLAALTLLPKLILVWRPFGGS